jgi:hypothetical protein
MNISDLIEFKDLANFQGYFDEQDNTLFIDQYNIGISFKLKMPLSLSYEASLGRDILDSPTKFKSIIIESIVLSIFFDEEDEKDDSAYGYDKLNGQTFKALQIYYQLFNKIPFYNLKIVENDGICPGPEYSKLEIICDELSIKKLSDLFIELISFDWINLSRIKNSNCHFISKANLNKRKLLPIISTNTKARRLGYLKFTINLFNHSRFFPTNYFAKLIERDSSLINKDLSLHIDNKGLIQMSRTGNSAKPYIELLSGLSLITIVNNSYILTKQAKVYFVLNNLISKLIIPDEKPQSEIPFQIKSISKFQLNIFDKAFFLRQILLNDTLYFWSILDILKITNCEISSKEIKSFFSNYVIDELGRFSRPSLEIKKIINRIKNWKKEEVYLEHLIEPRLNWMLDLDIISLSKINKNKSVYRLTENGMKLHSVLTFFYERTKQKIAIAEDIIEYNFFKLFTYAYNLDKGEAEFNELVIKEYLDEAFIYFKTDAPKRVAASSAINYICFKYFMKLDKIIEYKQLKDFLLSKKSDQFGIDWFSSEDDGSIYLKK